MSIPKPPRPAKASELGSGDGTGASKLMELIPSKFGIWVMSVEAASVTEKMLL